MNSRCPWWRRASLSVLVLALLGGDVHDALRAAGNEPTSSYAAIVSSDGPTAWWRMSATDDRRVRNQAAADLESTELTAEMVGTVGFGVPGPSGEEHPDFATDNQAAVFSKGKNYLRVADPGDGSPLDFQNGDSLTIEAWVKPAKNPGVSYGYILSKGRTHNPGFQKRNQNYSLRLAYSGRIARLSFYFTDSETPENAGNNAEGHRWNSKAVIHADERWHHVAVTYTFGEPDSIHGFIDGKESKGRWDLAGPTQKQPVVDNDEVWIGSTMGGRATFQGAIDEVALYRKILSPESIAKHVRIKRRDEVLAAVRSVADSAPNDRVQFDVFEEIADVRNWDVVPSNRMAVYESDAFALTRLPRKYNQKGLIVDRRGPLLTHAYSRIALPAGAHELLLRSLNGARLYVDDRPVAETPFLPLAGNGHNPVYELQPASSKQLSLPAAHNERTAKYESDGKPHVFSLVAQAGHRGRPSEWGELMVAVRQGDETFRLLGAKPHPSEESTTGSHARIGGIHGVCTDAGWLAFLETESRRRSEWERHDRSTRGKDERAYWDARHEWATGVVNATEPDEIPQTVDSNRVNNTIDRFIQHALEAEGVDPNPPAGDFSFLRRITLDVTGQIPTEDEIDSFLADPPETRRARAIDRLLQSPGWADHWVGYWQHVLAENPGLTKPSLNNSGPFRWFLYESFLDNKPFDRFVTELVLMEGGQRSGGPAGFALATNNDAPLAAKAHILGAAFLGVEMKCARCHDAPTHESTQADLFQLSAMLGRKPMAVPKTSTVPATPEQLATMAVTVSLKPGEPVEPLWPFAELAPKSAEALPQALIRKSHDTREELARQITHPSNRRFARVIVNRLWKRYLGRGIVDPVHDWESGEASHPKLLDYLARELVIRNYDLKYVAALILNSQAYQRGFAAGADFEKRSTLFASPTRRRMTAEQLSDSICLAAGKAYDSEPLTMNADGRQISKNFLSLGVPRRAWQFACTSNERERPSMSLPRAQAVVDLLMAYGWRQNRQEPVNARDETTTPVTPLVLANGVAVSRAVDLSDNGKLVELCLQDQPVEQLVERLCFRLLSRKPSPEESKQFSAFLADGYAERKTGAPKSPRRIDRSPLTWSNNLDAKANQIGEARQELALKGDPPTRRLTEPWRERVEDLVWTLINSPEFVFVP